MRAPGSQGTICLRRAESHMVVRREGRPEIGASRPRTSTLEIARTVCHDRLDREAAVGVRKLLENLRAAVVAFVRVLQSHWHVGLLGKATMRAIRAVRVRRCTE